MISDKKYLREINTYSLLAITAAAILLTAGLSNNNSSNPTRVQGQEMQTNNNNNTIRVEAGGELSSFLEM